MKSKAEDIKDRGLNRTVREKHFGYQTDAPWFLIPLKPVSVLLSWRVFCCHMQIPHFSRKALHNLPIWPLLVMLQRFESFEDCLN